MDLAITYDQNTHLFDVAISGYDLKTESGMRTAVIISLYTDRRAANDDIIPDGTTDRRGWWGDDVSEIDGDQIGSRLWLLNREKQTSDVLERAKLYAEEALAWLIDDGMAAAVSVLAEWTRPGMLGLQVTIQLLNNDTFVDVFSYPLQEAA